MPMTPSECDRFADLIGAHVDGELNAGATTPLRAHLATCPACAAEAVAIAALREALGQLRAETAPDSLRQRLAAALPETPPARAPARRAALRLLAAGVGGLAIGVGLMRALTGPDATHDATHDMLAGHARALLAEAPPQLVSSDQHRVRPWLTARLSVAAQVPTPEGFLLLGARLDMISGRAVAAILYRRRDHAITVYATAEAEAEGWPRAPQARRGFAMLPRLHDGVRYMLVSDLSAAELALLADAIAAP